MLRHRLIYERKLFFSEIVTLPPYIIIHHKVNNEYYFGLSGVALVIYFTYNQSMCVYGVQLKIEHFRIECSKRDRSYVILWSYDL